MQLVRKESQDLMPWSLTSECKIWLLLWLQFSTVCLVLKIKWECVAWALFQIGRYCAKNYVSYCTNGHGCCVDVCFISTEEVKEWRCLVFPPRHSKWVTELRCGLRGWGEDRSCRKMRASQACCCRPEILPALGSHKEEVGKVKASLAGGTGNPSQQQERGPWLLYRYMLYIYYVIRIFCGPGGWILKAFLLKAVFL